MTKLMTWVEQNNSTAIYAILSSVSDAEPVRHYTELDGKNMLHPLYANTAYAQWYPVMPYLVRLSPKSRFWQWIETTKSDDWGWLFASESTENELAPYFTSLTQVIMPDGERVFFKYWEQVYLSIILNTLHESTFSLIPSISSIHLNKENFEFHPKKNELHKVNTWWQVPERVINNIEKDDKHPLISNILTQLQENQGDIWLGFSRDILRNKISIFVENYNGIKEELYSELCQQLSDDLEL